MLARRILAALSVLPLTVCPNDCCKTLRASLPSPSMHCLDRDISIMGPRIISYRVGPRTCSTLWHSECSRFLLHRVWCLFFHCKNFCFHSYTSVWEVLHKYGSLPCQIDHSECIHMVFFSSFSDCLNFTFSKFWISSFTFFKYVPMVRHFAVHEPLTWFTINW